MTSSGAGQNWSCRPKGIEEQKNGLGIANEHCVLTELANQRMEIGQQTKNTICARSLQPDGRRTGRQGEEKINLRLSEMNGGQAQEIAHSVGLDLVSNRLTGRMRLSHFGPAAGVRKRPRPAGSRTPR
jgi:hypothetical protein